MRFIGCALAMAAVVACSDESPVVDPHIWYLTSVDLVTVPTAVPGGPCDTLHSSAMNLYADGSYLSEATYSNHDADGTETCYAPLSEIGTYVAHDTTVILTPDRGNVRTMSRHGSSMSATLDGRKHAYILTR